MKTRFCRAVAGKFLQFRQCKVGLIIIWGVCRISAESSKENCVCMSQAQLRIPSDLMRNPWPARESDSVFASLDGRGNDLGLREWLGTGATDVSHFRQHVEPEGRTQARLADRDQQTDDLGEPFRKRQLPSIPTLWQAGLQHGFELALERVELALRFARVSMAVDGMTARFISCVSCCVFRSPSSMLPSRKICDIPPSFRH